MTSFFNIAILATMLVKCKSNGLITLPQSTMPIPSPEYGQFDYIASGLTYAHHSVDAVIRPVSSCAYQ